MRTLLREKTKNPSWRQPGPGMTETPGSGLTDLTRTASLDITNASANAGTGGRNKTKFTDHRVTSGKTTISNTAHSIEKYPED